MMPMISVIVPVYNTGLILIDTIDSILSQTFENFELIIVDDGSNEETKLLCDECGKRDSRVHVIHKENGGICDARNVGLQQARGEYITFCDHDDCYDVNTLELEYKHITKENADLIIVGKKSVYDKREIIVGDEFVYDKCEIKQNICDIVAAELLETIWNVLYRSTITKGVVFDTEFKYGQEDINFNLEVILRCEKIVSIKTVLYNHIVRGDLSTSAKIHYDLIESLIRTSNHLYSIVNT